MYKKISAYFVNMFPASLVCFNTITTLKGTSEHALILTLSKLFLKHGRHFFVWLFYVRPSDIAVCPRLDDVPLGASIMIQ